MSPRVGGGPVPRRAVLGAALVLAAGCGGAAPAPEEPASVVEVQAAPPSAAAAVPEPAEPDAGERVEKADARLEDKKRQCDRLIEVLNAEGSKLRGRGVDPAAFRQMADDIDAAATRIGEVRVTLPELVGFRDDMEKFYVDFAAAARDAATAIESGDLSMVLSATKELSELANKNTKLVTDINSFCQGK